jgi:hypothetical protein
MRDARRYEQLFLINLLAIQIRKRRPVSNGTNVKIDFIVPRFEISLNTFRGKPRECSTCNGGAALHPKDENRFPVRSLTPPQAVGNALAIAVQPNSPGAKTRVGSCRQFNVSGLSLRAYGGIRKIF